jgi:hypothetical protein
MLLPVRTHELWLTDEDTEPLDRHRPIISYCIGQRKL